MPGQETHTSSELAPLIEKSDQYPAYTYAVAREIIGQQPTGALISVVSTSERRFFQPLAPADPEGVGLLEYQAKPTRQINSLIESGASGIFLIGPSLTGKTQLITGPTNAANDLGLTDPQLIHKVRAPGQTIIKKYDNARYKSGEVSPGWGISYDTFQLAMELQQELFGQNVGKRVVIFDELHGDLHALRLKVLLEAADVVVVVLGGRLSNLHKRSIADKLNRNINVDMQPSHAKRLDIVETSIQPLNGTQLQEYGHLLMLQTLLNLHQTDDDDVFVVSKLLVEKLVRAIREYHTPLSFFSARELLSQLFSPQLIKERDPSNVLALRSNLHNIRANTDVGQLDFQLRSWLFAEGASLGSIVSEHQLSQSFFRRKGV